MIRVIVDASAANIEHAAALLRAGDVVVFPTETVYGLGADATNPTAAARIFAIKERPSFDPLIVHIADADGLLRVAAQVPSAALKLTRLFWPGPLTLVLPRTALIPDIVTAGLDSVAVRVPEHPVARELIRQAQRPIAAPSANKFGRVSPTTAQHVADQLGSEVSLILDGGPCRIGLESTIVSFVGDAPTLLRSGGIPLESIEAEIGAVRISTTSENPVAPGQLPRHYAPRIPLRLIKRADEVSAGERANSALIQLFPTAHRTGFAHIEILAPDSRIETAAANLFAALRRLEIGDFKTIYAEEIPESGLGRAIMDRLRRASYSD